MANNYNVDDILDEIKRKKSTGAAPLAVAAPSENHERPPVRERDSRDDYDDEYDEEIRGGSRAAYSETYDNSSDRRSYEAPRGKRVIEENYEPQTRRKERDDEPRYEVPRYTAARRSTPDDENDYAPSNTRKAAYPEDDDEYRAPPRRTAPAYADRFSAPVRNRAEADDEEYREAPRRAYRRDDEYEPTPRRKVMPDYEEEYEAPPRRRAEPKADIYSAAVGRRAAVYADDADRDEYDEPPRRRKAEAQEEYSTGQTRMSDRDEDYRAPRRREPERIDDTEDDLSILRSRITRTEEPKRNKFADLDNQMQSEKTVGKTGLITDRADILRNFGKHANIAENSFDENYRSAKSERRIGGNASEPTRHVTQSIDINEADETKAALSATQMNLDLYAIDDAGEVRDRVKATKQGGYSTEEENIIPDADDFNTPKDANNVYRDIASIKKGIQIRLAVTGVIAAVLIYFGIALNNISLPLPFFMLPESDMRNFVGAQLILMLIAVLSCSSTVGGGLVSMFKLKANGDSPVAIASLAVIAQGAVLVVFPEAVTKTGVNLYFALAALGLLFNNIGKLFMINRIERNFKLLADAGYQRHAFSIVSDRNLARDLTRNQDLEMPVIGYSHPADFLTNFLSLSYTEDYGENISKITTPMFLVFSLIASVITQFIYGDVFASLTVFTAMTAVCAPLTTTITGNLPLAKMNKALVKDGSMVAGYTALDKFDDINCLVVKDSELFGPESITLHGIKSFDQKRIDEAMIDAASVVCKSECVLSGIFTQMIGGNERILKKADSIVYEDSMGISAWVDGKRVLIGNRSLMENHSIEIPSKDYERKFVRDGREILYLSNSGELTAMFVLSYGANPDIADQLHVLEERGIGISVYTTDSNITPQKIAEVFDYPEDMVEIVPYKLHSQCDKLLEPKERAKAEIVYNGMMASKVRILSSIVSAKTSIVLGTILQSVGMIAGYGFIAFFAFTNSIGSATFSLMMAYQFFWAIVVMALPNLRRY